MPEVEPEWLASLRREKDELAALRESEPLRWVEKREASLDEREEWLNEWTKRGNELRRVFTKYAMEFLLSSHDLVNNMPEGKERSKMRAGLDGMGRANFEYQQFWEQTVLPKRGRPLRESPETKGGIAMSDKCPLCGDTGSAGTDAYGERVRCMCRQEAEATKSATPLQAPVVAGVATNKLSADDVARVVASLESARTTHIQPMEYTAEFAGSRVIVLQPGDRVVLEHPGVLSPPAKERLTRDFKAFLGGEDVDVAVLEEGMRLTVVRGQV